MYGRQQQAAYVDAMLSSSSDVLQSGAEQLRRAEELLSRLERGPPQQQPAIPPPSNLSDGPSNARERFPPVSETGTTTTRKPAPVVPRTPDLTRPPLQLHHHQPPQATQQQQYAPPPQQWDGMGDRAGDRIALESELMRLRRENERLVNICDRQSGSSEQVSSLLAQVEMLRYELHVERARRNSPSVRSNGPLLPRPLPTALFHISHPTTRSSSRTPTTARRRRRRRRRSWGRATISDVHPKAAFYYRHPADREQRKGAHDRGSAGAQRQPEGSAGRCRCDW